MTRRRAASTTKFFNKRCVVDDAGRIWPAADAKRLQIVGDRCDSLGEARHLLSLRERQRRGEIAGLRHPHAFELHVNGVKLGELRADFSFVDVASARLVVQDFKGRHNKSRDTEYRFFKWKSNHLLAQYGLEVHEVHASDSSSRSQWAAHVTRSTS